MSCTRWRPVAPHCNSALHNVHNVRDRAACDVGQLWPHVSLAATGIVKEQLNPQLAMNKPKWISDIYLHRFNLGEEPPSISGVKVCFACIQIPTIHPNAMISRHVYVESLLVSACAFKGVLMYVFHLMCSSNVCRICGAKILEPCQCTSGKHKSPAPGVQGRGCQWRSHH